MSRHLIIPDTQVKPGVDISHMDWIGQYAAEKHPDVVVHLGDHWDLPSLSSYDKPGSKAFEGRRYLDDVEAGNEAMELLTAPMDAEIKRTKRLKNSWNPRRIYIPGNHDWSRIDRAINSDPARLEGLMSTDDLKTPGWERAEYLDPVWVDGIAYCLTPDHEILMADLTYRPLSKLSPGEEILAFDEYTPPELNYRQYRKGTILAIDPIDAPVYRVEFASGKVFHATGDHRWLAKKDNTMGWRWFRTSELRLNVSTVCHPFPHWKENESWESGYLAGILDGEGCVSKNLQGGITLCVSQNEGLVLDKILNTLDSLGFQYGISKPRDCVRVKIKGSTGDRLSLLGTVGAPRLIGNVPMNGLGRVQSSEGRDLVVAITPVGVQEVMQVATSTGTMIVDGYAHHNCHYFYNPLSGRPYAGASIDTRLKTIGHSFSSGHQQVMMFGRRPTLAGTWYGLVCGTCYLHEEEYRGPQGNAQDWQGIVIKNEVANGEYDVSFVSLNFLSKKYTGKPLA